MSNQLSALADAGAVESSATNAIGPPGVVPLTRGFNGSLATTSQHDAAGGWSNILSPNIAYRFNKHFSIDAGVSVLPYINVVVTTDVKNGKGVVTKTVSALNTKHLLLSDTVVSGAYDQHFHWLDYNLTGTMGIPTGDDASGLGAGQFTYAFVNHFEKQLGDYITPDIELGFDDSPNLLTPRIDKTYLVVGNSAHFQAGLDISLPFDIDFESDAYEELPVGKVSVSSTTTKGVKGKQVSTTTVSQESAGEDNGFTNTLQVPLNGHITLSGFYNRSLRNHDDTAGFSFTFLLRSAKQSASTKVK